MRKITDKYYVEGDQIYKSNGDLVPEDEPLFLLRAKDIVSIPTLRAYLDMCVSRHCNTEHLYDINTIIKKFADWQEKNKDKMKIPNITKGA